MGMQQGFQEEVSVHLYEVEHQAYGGSEMLY